MLPHYVSLPACQPTEGGLQLQALLGFVATAQAEGIVAGVQVKLLNELAVRITGSQAPGVEQPPGADPAAQLGAAQDSGNAGGNSSNPGPAPAHLPEGPQLHIQPLNLSAGLHGPTDAPASQLDAAGGLATPDAGLANHAAAALMATLTGSMGGSDHFDATAAALMQHQQQQVVATCAGADLSSMGPSHELLQAVLGYASDAAAVGGQAAAAAAAGAVPVATAPEAVAATAGKAPGARKQRFTREQHAAILESVERNYAQYPSRYTELVIKEMQLRFPGIELNNACVRKIKFRANEASKQQPSAVQACLQDAGLPDHQAAADAAHGLVGLACAAAAAAAAAAADEAKGLTCNTGQQVPAAEEEEEGVNAVVVKTEAGAVCEPEQPASALPNPLPSAQPGASATGLQAHDSDSPETVSFSAAAAGTAMLTAIGAATPAAQQQPQPSMLQQLQLPEQGTTAAMPAAAATAAAAAAASPANSAAGLQLKVPDAGTGDDCIDSATAAAAEAMHLLAGISSQQQPTAAAAGGDQGTAGAGPEAGPAAAAATAEAAAGAAGSKRKRDSLLPGCDTVATTPTSGAGASSPLPGQVADALSAAADLAASSLAAQQQQQPGLVQQQGATDHAAAAACMAASGYEQQQQLMQQLLHLQQQQPAWDVAYAGQLTALGLQQQQQAAALQHHLGSSAASLAGLQQQQQQLHHLQAPGSFAGPASAAAAAGGGPRRVGAAAGGQQPAAKRQRLSGTQMAELIASVKHHVQANPERYTHCVIKDMKEKYPDLELNMGQIRKIKFRTLGNANNAKQAGKAGPEGSEAAAADAAAVAAAAAGFGDAAAGMCAAARQ